MKISGKLKLLGLLAGAVMIGLLLLPKRPAIPPLPVPNGYDDLQRAAQEAVSLRHLTYGQASAEELREIVRTNQVALELARAGFAKPCRVSTDYHVTADAYAARHMPLMAGFKKLALAFRAEGELAEREHNPNKAAQIYLDGIRLAHEMARGGLLIDRMVGIAMERTSLDPLRSIVESLDPGACREIAEALEQIEARRQSSQDTWNEERIWVAHVGSLQQRVALQIVRLIRPDQAEASRRKLALQVTELTAQTRALILELSQRHSSGRDPQGQ